jgi:hypothetical protein
VNGEENKGEVEEQGGESREKNSPSQIARSVSQCSVRLTDYLPSAQPISLHSLNLFSTRP